MHTQLMGAAGQRLQGQTAHHFALVILMAPHYAPAGLRGQAIRVHFHPPAAAGVQLAQRQVNQPLWRLWLAFHQGPIGLGNFTLLEQKAKLFQCLAMAPQHQTA